MDDSILEEEAKAKAKRDEKLAEAEKNIHAPSLRSVNVIALVLALAAAIFAAVSMSQLFAATEEEEAAHARFENCTSAASKLIEASDDLTHNSLLYVATGDPKFLDAYIEEIDGEKNRDKAVAVLEEEARGTKAASELADALASSNELAEYEFYAMRLTAEAYGLSPMPSRLAAVRISPEDAALSSEAKAELARSMLLGSAYTALKHPIQKSVVDCTEALTGALKNTEDTFERNVSALSIQLSVAVSIFLCVIAAFVILNWILVMRPMGRHRRNIRDNAPLDPMGAKEMQRVVYAYNDIYEENHRRTLLLRHEAQTDALTGLLNRGSYDKLMQRYTDNIGLAIVDLDNFKDVNDKYGHAVGDEILRKVAVAISYHFRTSDYTCRIGGDEFAIVMTEIDDSKMGVVAEKLDAIAAKLADTSDGLPAVTISTGIAFSSEEPGGATDLYIVADKALYAAKHAGRARYAFADEAGTPGAGAE